MRPWNNVGVVLVCCASAYGLTEASPGTHCPTDEDIKHHTVGVALQNTQFKVADNTHTLLEVEAHIVIISQAI